MPKPFDATLKAMLEAAPADWTTLAGYPPTKVEVIDADISTLSGAADKVLRVHGPPASIFHLDFQTGPDMTLPCRTHVYNAVLEGRHLLPVRSVLVLLRRQANLSNLTGVYERNFPGEPPYLTFRYQVIRVWELPAAQLLAGGVGTLPLAPISAVAEADLPGVIEKMRERLRGQTRTEISNLWTATYVLMGLCYEPALVHRLLQGVIAMEDSSTYQFLIAKGERQGALRELRKVLLLQGRDQFGEPPPEAVAAIEANHDVDRLEQLLLRLRHVKSWQELLDLPQPPPRRRKRPSNGKR